MKFVYDLQIFFLWLFLVIDDDGDAVEPSETLRFLGGLPLLALPFTSTWAFTMSSVNFVCWGILVREFASEQWRGKIWVYTSVTAVSWNYFSFALLVNLHLGVV